MGDDTSRRGIPLWPGTVGPESATPARAPGALRRTTHLDAVRPAGPGRELLVAGRGRDLLTTATGEARVLLDAGLRLRARVVARDLTVESVDADPDVDAIEHLAGTSLGAGFRGRARAALPHGLDGHPLAALLDDVPVLALIARSGPFRTGERPVREQRPPPRDVCAGWRAGGELERRSGTDAALVGRGPAAPALARPDDPRAWHDVPSPAAGTFRRVRRIDLTPGPADGPAPPDRDADHVAVDAMFRDTFVEPDGAQPVIHEYRLTGAIDVRSRTVVSLAAHAGVLPGPDCVHAAAGVARLVGRTLDDVAASVRRDLAGTVGCTHLTDAIHALAAAAPLLDHLVPVVPVVPEARP